MSAANGDGSRTTSGRGKLYESVLETIGDTPCIRINRLAPDHVTVYVKFEAFNPAGSVKDRLAISIIEEAEKSGALKPGQTVIEATSGNTGIALAWLGRLKGYKVTIVMPDSMSLERRQLMKLHGAELILTKGEYGVQKSIDTVNEMASNDSKYFKADQFANPANPLAHYETTGVEIMEDNQSEYKKLHGTWTDLSTKFSSQMAKNIQEGNKDYKQLYNEWKKYTDNLSTKLMRIGNNGGIDYDMLVKNWENYTKKLNQELYGNGKNQDIPGIRVSCLHIIAIQ